MFSCGHKRDHEISRSGNGKRHEGRINRREQAEPDRSEMEERGQEPAFLCEECGDQQRLQHGVLVGREKRARSRALESF